MPGQFFAKEQFVFLFLEKVVKKTKQTFGKNEAFTVTLTL